MNGVFEEASMLAHWIGCFFLPIALGMTVTRSRWKYCGWAMFALCLAILFGSTALTGIILGIIGMIAASIRILMEREGIVTGVCCAIALALCAGTAFFGTDAHTRLPNLHHRSPARLAITLASLEVLKKHPVLGVGRGHLAAHVTHEDVYTKALDDPELRVWKERGAISHLSALPAAMAEYGIPATLCVMFWLLCLFRKLHSRLRQHPAFGLYRFSFVACGVWLLMSAVAVLGSFETRNALFLLPLFCFYAIAELEEGGAAP
jgi:hypothetical protein